MIISKKIWMILLCISLVFCLTIPAFAVNARLSHGVSAITLFGITSTGMAEVSVDYQGNRTTYTSVTVETYIQKRTLGFIWTKVDNGEENKTWVDTSTEEIGDFVHHLQLDNTGTYRAVFKITFSGTGAADDVIEDTIEDVYE